MRSHLPPPCCPFPKSVLIPSGLSVSQIVWQFVAPLLVREARYQREGGNEALATSVEAEIEVLILSMRRISTAFDVPSA